MKKILIIVLGVLLIVSTKSFATERGKCSVYFKDLANLQTEKESSLGIRTFNDEKIKQIEIVQRNLKGKGYRFTRTPELAKLSVSYGVDSHSNYQQVYTQNFGRVYLKDLETQESASFIAEDSTKWFWIKKPNVLLAEATRQVPNCRY